MLAGTTPLSELATDLPTIPTWSIDTFELTSVEILQVQYELAAVEIQRFLPPALHPTLPPLGQWTCWDVPDSPWGAFLLVQFRVSCRSGARPRAFLLGAAIDNATAGEGTRKQLGT